jgi:hypothetical protein
MNELFVTNKNGFNHKDSFNGVEYAFPVDEEVLVPVEAAEHMFGFRRPNKSDNLVRLGWANLPNEEGVKRLAKFVFTQPVMVRAPVEETPTQDAE